MRRIEAFKPDVIGVSMLTPTAPRGYRAIRLLREEMPDVVTVADGPHPTAMWREALEEGFDIVVLREGEYTARDLLATLEREGFDPEALRRVDGIAFRDPRSGEIAVTRPRLLIQNLDELPARPPPPPHGEVHALQQAHTCGPRDDEPGLPIRVHVLLYELLLGQKG